MKEVWNDCPICNKKLIYNSGLNTPLYCTLYHYFIETDKYSDFDIDAEHIVIGELSFIRTYKGLYFYTYKIGSIFLGSNSVWPLDKIKNLTEEKIKKLLLLQ